MEFRIEKQGQEYIVKEEDRVIFRCDHEIEEKLISLYLRNIYGDEALGLYQVKKWFTPFFPKISQCYTIYEKDDKLGELHHVTKGVREMSYQGVTYRFYGGVFASSYIVLCFERNNLCAKMTFDDGVLLEFTNSSMGSLFAALAVLFHEFHLYEGLSQTAFLKQFHSLNS